MSRQSRRTDSRGEEPRRSASVSMPGTLGAALSEFIALKGLASPRSDARLAQMWAEVAGERIAERTRVMGINRGVLQVAVVSSAMLNELASFHRDRLIEELRAREPRLKLRDIKFRLRGDLAGSGVGGRAS